MGLFPFINGLRLSLLSEMKKSFAGESPRVKWILLKVLEVNVYTCTSQWYESRCVTVRGKETGATLNPQCPALPFSIIVFHAECKKAAGFSQNDSTLNSFFFFFFCSAACGRVAACTTNKQILHTLRTGLITDPWLTLLCELCFRASIAARQFLC